MSHAESDDGSPDIDVEDGPPKDAASHRRGVLVGIAAVCAIVAVLLSGLIGYRLGNSTPGDNSVEAGFSRDMQTHHAQAVEMSFIIRDKTADPAIRTLAYDIITSQQQQIGQMYGWLQVWGLSQTGSQPPMAWMAGGHDGMQMSGADASGAAPSGSSSPGAAGASAMPGMASAAQLQQLRDLKGRAADRLFLQLMIAHHQGGLQMAQAVHGRTDVRAVTVLADAIRTAQTAEITQMRQMLAARPAAG